MMRPLLVFFYLFSFGSALASPDYFLTGEFNGWQPNQTAFKFSEKGDIYTLSLESLSGEFKITTANWEHQYGAGKALVDGEIYRCVESGNGFNMSLADPSARNITLTFDDKNKTVSLSSKPSLYLTGDFNGWKISPDFKFFESDGLYILKCPNFKGDFKIVSANGKVSLGAADSSAVLEGKESSLLSFGPPCSFGGLQDSEMGIRITFNPAGNADGAGVGFPLDEFPDDGNVEYFTLQGLRVDTPSAGIYIRKCGSRIQKIIVR